VKRVEAKLADVTEFDRAIAAGASLGIVWTHNERAPGAPARAQGERVVDDLVIDNEIGDLDATSRGHTVRRITADPQDLGVVYDGSLKRIGRVVTRKGGGRLIEWK
jgi:hypothetical protein